MVRAEDDTGLHATVTRVTEGDVLQVPYADVLAMADDFDRAGGQALSRAGRAEAACASPGLLASAPFSPATAAAAEAALVAAGAALTAWSAQIVVDAQSVRRVVHRLATVDAIAHVDLRLIAIGAAAHYETESAPPEVHATSLGVPMSRVPPTGLTSLVDHAGEVGRLSDDPARKGTIEVQTLTGGDGRRRHVVYLPGVDAWNLPGLGDDVRDLGAALHLAAGGGTAYGAGVLQALGQAGVEPGEQVLLVGHSEGGMQAVQLAIQDSPYDITNVVTLGSPTVPGEVPADVDVLALEHLGDAVPLVDGGAEPSPQVVSVTFDSGISGSLSGNHEVAHYSAGAAAAEHSTDPVLQHAVDGLAPFLGRPGDEVTSTVFQITRGHSAGGLR